MTQTIQFKSTPENWFKEYFGIKSNTVRKEDNGLRFGIMDKWIKSPFDLRVEIINTVTNDSFSRAVKDITIFDEGIYIISWG